MAIDKFSINLGDSPNYDGQITKHDILTPVDLTGKTVTATMKNTITGAAKFTGRSVTVTSSGAVDGLFTFSFLDTDTDIAGTYKIYFHVMPDNITYPNPAQGLAIVEIVAM